MRRGILFSEWFIRVPATSVEWSMDGVTYPVPAPGGSGSTDWAYVGISRILAMAPSQRCGGQTAMGTPVSVDTFWQVLARRKALSPSAS